MDNWLVWIGENREWLFSGVGVVVVVALVRAVVARGQDRNPTNLARGRSVADVVAEGERAQPPTFASVNQNVRNPDELLEEFAEVPLLQKPAFVDQCIGVKIAAEGTLRDAQATKDGSIDLAVVTPRHHLLRLNVDPSKYPGLGLLRSGEPFHVRGTVVQIDALWIDLTDAVVQWGDSIR